MAVWPSRGVCTLAVFVQVPLAAYAKLLAVTTSTTKMVVVIEDFVISDLILYLLLQASLLSSRIRQVARVPNGRACPNTPRYPDHFAWKQIARHILEALASSLEVQ